MPLVTRRLAVFAVLGLTLVAAGCGDDDDSDESFDDTVDQTTDPGASTDETEPEEDEDEGIGPDLELTPEGTELALGEPATVPIEDGAGWVEVSVDSITAGTPEDLADLQLEGGETGDLYYVTLTVTNIGSPEDLGSYVPGSYELYAMQDDDTPASPVAEFSTFEPCENEDPTDLPANESFTTCQIYLAPTGVAVGSVEFLADTATDPIVWS